MALTVQETRSAPPRLSFNQHGPGLHWQRWPPSLEHTLPTPLSPKMPFSLCTSMVTAPPHWRRDKLPPSNSTSETWLQPHGHHFLRASYRFWALAGCRGSPNLHTESPSRLLRVQLLPGTLATFSPPGESDLSFKPCSGCTPSSCFPPDEPLLLCLISAPHTCFHHSTRHTVL